MAKKEYTELQLSFLTHLQGDEAKGNIRKAMKLAGYSDTTAIKDVVKSLADEITDIAKQLLAANSVKAVIALSDVLDQPSRPGSDKAIAAAREVLDRVGVHKKDQGGTTIKADHIFIMPAKDSVADETESE